MTVGIKPIAAELVYSYNLTMIEAMAIATKYSYLGECTNNVIPIGNKIGKILKLRNKRIWDKKLSLRKK